VVMNNCNNTYFSVKQNKVLYQVKSWEGRGFFSLLDSDLLLSLQIGLVSRIFTL